MVIQSKLWPSFPGGQSDARYGSDGMFAMAEGAKNTRVPTGCLGKLVKLDRLEIATFNCRSLSNEARLQELEEELKFIKWDIIGLSEVRRKDEGMLELKSGHSFYFKGNKTGQNGGVGFLVNKRLKNNILEVEGVSDRLAKIEIKLSKRYNVQIIQVYAPTSSHTDDEIEEFYEEVQKLHDKGNAHYKIVMGDFNAKIGTQKADDKVVGNFGYGERNERGDTLVEFAETITCL